MSIALVVTAGFGTGTLSGDIAGVTTRGYIAGSAGPVLPSDGVGWWALYDAEMRRKQAERAKRKKAKAKARRIKDKMLRELALEERRIEDETARRAELNRLSMLVAKNKGFVLEWAEEDVLFAVEQALERQTYSTQERMERLLRNWREEEDFLLEAVRILTQQ